MATAIANRSTRRDAADMLGIPETTIEYWIERARNDSDYAGFVQEKERTLNVGEYIIAEAMLKRLERLVQADDGSKQLSDSALAYGIMKTKIREHATPSSVTPSPSTPSNTLILTPPAQGTAENSNGS